MSSDSHNCVAFPSFDWSRCFCIITILFCEIVSAETTEKIVYYSIYASTAQELDAQLSLNARNGFHADTQWSIQPRYRFTKENDSCVVSDSSVTLTVTYTMPEWVNKAEASAELQTKWNTWYSNLLSHEKNHGFNGRQAYSDIKHGIYVLNRARTCSQLTNDLRNMIDSVLFKYSQEDKLYDQRTRHGAPEGATSSFSSNE